MIDAECRRQPLEGDGTDALGGQLTGKYNSLEPRAIGLNAFERRLIMELVELDLRISVGSREGIGQRRAEELNCPFRPFRPRGLGEQWLDEAFHELCGKKRGKAARHDPAPLSLRQPGSCSIRFNDLHVKRPLGQYLVIVLSSA